MDTSCTQIHDLSFSLVITGTSIKKSGGVYQRLRKPKRQSSMCNPETLATLAHMTQDEDNPETLVTLAHMTQDEDNPETLAHMTQDEDNPETLATLAHMTQDEDNPETLAHMTQNEDKQDTKIQYRKLKS